MLYFGGGNLTEILSTILFYFGLFCIISVYVGGKKKLSDQIQCGKSRKVLQKSSSHLQELLGDFITEYTVPSGDTVVS
jgi:hypothetical protein